MSKKLVVSGLLLTLTMINLTAYAGEQYLQQRQQEQAERQRIQQERYARMYNSNGFSSSLMDTVNGNSNSNSNSRNNSSYRNGNYEYTLGQYKEAE